jgi:hypothetical protein
MHDPFGLTGHPAEVLLPHTEERIASPHPGILVPVLEGSHLPELRGLGPDAGNFGKSGLEPGVLGEETEFLGIGARREIMRMPRGRLVDGEVVDPGSRVSVKTRCPMLPGSSQKRFLNCIATFITCP